MLELAAILCPVDFSARSSAAARYAGALACHFHSGLTLLHVIEPVTHAWGASEFGSPLLGEIIEAQRERARQEMARFLPDAGPAVKRVISGDPALKIVEYAH